MKYSGSIINNTFEDSSSGVILSSSTLIINFINDEDNESFGGFTGQITLTKDDGIDKTQTTDELLEIAANKVKNNIYKSVKGEQYA